MTIDKAFILAAGYGTRMRPITETIPKPMVTVSGKSLLERTLDGLEQAGVKQCVINTHHLTFEITNPLANRQTPAITFSHEDVLLDTGGGIKNAIDFFEGNPFYVLSGDGLWQDAANENTLVAMADFWDPEKMDILILLQPVSSMKLTHGVGDYHIEVDGRAVRAHDKSGDYMFTSMRINHPRIFENAPDSAFSYLSLLDEAEKKNRLYGLVHRGEWHHISTPEDLARVDEDFKAKSKHRI